MSPSITASTCVNHADRPATTRCNHCQSPLCAACTFIFQGKEVCATDNAALRSGTATAPAPMPAYAQSSFAPASPSPSSMANAVGAYVPPPQLAATLAPGQGGLTFGGVFAGIGLGFVIGLVATIAWIAIIAAIHFNIGYFAAGIGWAIGWGVVTGCKQGGTVPAIISGVLSLLFIGIGSVIVYNGMPSIIGWVILVIGVYGGFKMPMRAGDGGA